MKRLFFNYWRIDIVLPVILIILAIFLRIGSWGIVPPSPYWEEVALGYDAYSIAQTGKDHHGNVWPVVAFESFGDWKPSGYFYLAAVAVKVLGLTLTAVRLPSLLAGFAIVAGFVVLSRRLSIPVWIALLVSGASPWLVHFSRAAWESSVATAFIVWMAVFGLEAVKGKTISLPKTAAAIILCAAAAYTYHAARFIAPTLLIAIAVYQFSYAGRSLVTAKNTWKIAGVVLLGLLSFLPLLRSLTDTSVTHRFSETSIFSQIEHIEKSNAYRAASDNSFIARIMYHRYVIFSGEILQNLTKHLSPEFLFISGDSNPRHSVGYIGHLYHIEALFLLVGISIWLRQRKKLQLLLLAWLLLALLPASISQAAPHALRILPASIPLLLLVASGISGTLEWTKMYGKKWLPIPIAQSLAVSAILLMYVVEAGLFWRYYTRIYPALSVSEWQYGYEQMVGVVSDQLSADPTATAVISRTYGRPAMYWWFYTQTPPSEVQAAQADAPKDQSEFLAFNQIQFGDVSKLSSEDNESNDPTIFAGSPEEIVNLTGSVQTEPIAEIRDLNNKVVWVVVRTTHDN